MMWAKLKSSVWLHVNSNEKTKNEDVFLFLLADDTMRSSWQDNLIIYIKKKPQKQKQSKRKALHYQRANPTK